jgi:hypothetical protein
LAGVPPELFQGPNDYADATLEIVKIDGLDGKLEIANNINTMYLPAVALWLHPSLTTLETDLGTAVRGWSVALAEENAPDSDGQGGRYSLELS